MCLRARVCVCVLMMFFNFMYVLLFIKYFRTSPNKVFPFFACYFEPKLGKHLNRLFICCTGKKLLIHKGENENIINNKIKKQLSDSMNSFLYLEKTS